MSGLLDISSSVAVVSERYESMRIGIAIIGSVEADVLPESLTRCVVVDSSSRSSSSTVGGDVTGGLFETPAVLSLSSSLSMDPRPLCPSEATVPVCPCAAP